MDISRKIVGVEEAESMISTCKFFPKIEDVDWHNSLNRITASDWQTDEDIPSFDRVMMDGIAIQYKEGVTEWEVSAIQKAGEAAHSIGNYQTAIEIMTGAILPLGADTIVPYEHLDWKESHAVLIASDLKKGQNVHLRGRDRKKGDQVLKSKSKIRYTEIGLAASLGKLSIPVFKRPRITIISTGDELVDPKEQPASHQIRMSNVFVLQSMLQTMGMEARLVHAVDQQEILREIIKEGLATSDVLMLTGGVSKGKFDLVPDVLNENGVEQLFHGINQRPGKPMWFGKKENTIVFGFPGNPVSTLVCARRYFIPWLSSQYGESITPIKAKSGFDIQAHSSLTLFVQVTCTQNEDGFFIVERSEGQGSGDFSQLSVSHGFAEITPGGNNVVKGDLIHFWPYKL
jgi:molybdopterin molybdotransferase